MAEPRTRIRRPQVDDPVKELADWLQLLNELISDVRDWVQPEWSTRVIEKEMFDYALGKYEAPALLMQRAIPRVILEPITRFAPGTDGVVRLYLMPAYDNIATLARVEGEWKLKYIFRSDKAVVGIRNAEALPLTEENFQQVLAAIAIDAT